MKPSSASPFSPKTLPSTMAASPSPSNSSAASSNRSIVTSSNLSTRTSLSRAPSSRSSALEPRMPPPVQATETSFDGPPQLHDVEERIYRECPRVRQSAERHVFAACSRVQVPPAHLPPCLRYPKASS